MLILCGLVLAFAVNTRYVGWVLVIAVFAETLYKIAVKYFKHKQHKIDWSYIKHEIWIIAAFFAIHGLFYLAFPQKIIYYDNPKVLTLFERISVNANYNYAVLKYFFSCFDEGFLNYVVSYGIVFTALIGMLIFIFKPDQLKPTILLFFLLGYIASILIHQYSDTGFRLLIPIITLILFFATYALFVVLAIIPYKQWLVFCLGLLVLFCYKQNSGHVLMSGKDIMPGPYSPEAQATFDYINKNVPEKAGVMFSKPRALTYFTNRKTYVNTEMAARPVIESELQKINPDYVLVCTEITDDSTKVYFEHYQAPWQIVYNNEKFVLLKHGGN